MNKTPEQLIEEYSSFPTEKRQYEIDGKKYFVTRHFTGDKQINKAVYELARSCADREAGLT